MNKYDHAQATRNEDPRHMAAAYIAGTTGKECLNPRNTVLANMADYVENLNKQTCEIEANLTAFVCRITGNGLATEGALDSPTPVPNGALQTVDYGLGNLQKVLDRLAEKVNCLNRLA